MYKLTKLNADLSVAADQTATDHPILHLQREIYGHQVAILFATVAPPKDLSWQAANTWCREQRVGGFEDWDSTTPEGAQLLINHARTEWPLVDPSYLPNHAGKWVWTKAEDLTPPRGCAFAVILNYGGVYRDRQSNHYSALPCRPGQILVDR
ncbi:MAG: hypothetical protein RLZZ200_507 [Pseudomonadota bacterium]|jgi:hypothetical protein